MERSNRGRRFLSAPLQVFRHDQFSWLKLFINTRTTMIATAGTIIGCFPAKQGRSRETRARRARETKGARRIIEAEFDSARPTRPCHRSATLLEDKGHNLHRWRRLRTAAVLPLGVSNGDIARPGDSKLFEEIRGT